LKILYVAPYLSENYRLLQGNVDVGGSLAAQRKIELMCELLSNLGHSIRILSSITLNPPKSSIWRESYREHIACGGHLIEVSYPSTFQVRPFGGILNTLRARQIAKRLNRSFHPDTVIIYNSYLFEFIVASWYRFHCDTPILLEIEDLPLARRRGWLNIKPWLDQQCWNKLMDITTGFTAVNARIQALLPKSKPTVLLPGILDQRLIECAKNRETPFSGPRRILGYFGGLSEAKGVGVLLELAKILPHPWEIVVCGSGDLSPLFREATYQQDSRIHYFGTLPVEEMYNLLCNCDCTLVPPENISGDGSAVFPFKIFEYAAANTHIIAPQIGAMDGCDYAYIQRWDGQVNSLPRLLVEAESDFSKENYVRNHFSAKVVDCYSIDGITSQIYALLECINCK